MRVAYILNSCLPSLIMPIKFIGILTISVGCSLVALTRLVTASSVAGVPFIVRTVLGRLVVVSRTDVIVWAALPVPVSVVILGLVTQYSVALFSCVRFGPATLESVTPALAITGVVVRSVVMFVVIVLGAKCRPWVQLKLVAARTICPIIVVALGGGARFTVLSLVATTERSACLTLVGRRRRGATGRLLPLALRWCIGCLRLVFGVCCWLIG